MLEALTTPCVLLDRNALGRNCARMADVAARHGVALRPHMKTAKSAEVGRIATRGQEGGITVSTIAEARYFARHGFRDLTYAVGIAAAKLDQLDEIQRVHGARIAIIADHPDAITAAAARAASLGAHFDLLIEIDTGGARGGVAPDGEALPALASLVTTSGALSLAGVLTHAGHSYHARSADEIASIAEAERSGAVRAARRLRDAGHACPVVSVGSTPTALNARSLEGVSEIRPGVYMFFDLHQAALGLCTLDDIAISVLATVIGHNLAAGRAVIDAGGLALSKDTSAREFRDGAGYGLVRAGGQHLAGHRVADIHQEHGLIAGPGGGAPDWQRLPIGSRIEILPNHACMTAAPYDRYVVTGGDHVEFWETVSGW